MSFTFETASISLCVGAVLSLLLQGKVLDEASIAARRSGCSDISGR